MQSLKDTFITVAGSPVELSHSIKSLVVNIDENLTFDEHVRNVCKASYYHIRGRRHIRAAMSKNTACTVASAIIGSRLDYCNAIFVGIFEANLNKLQYVQNTWPELSRELVVMITSRQFWQIYTGYQFVQG